MNLGIQFEDCPICATPDPAAETIEQEFPYGAIYGRSEVMLTATITYLKCRCGFAWMASGGEEAMDEVASAYVESVKPGLTS